MTPRFLLSHCGTLFVADVPYLKAFDNQYNTIQTSEPVYCSVEQGPPHPECKVKSIHLIERQVQCRFMMKAIYLIVR